MTGQPDTVIIGLRNELFEDGAFGILVVRHLKRMQIGCLDVVEAAEHELSDYLDKYRKAIVVYSFHDIENGEIVEIEMRPGRGGKACSFPQEIEFPHALSLWRTKSPSFPELVKVFCAPQSGFFQSRAANGDIRMGVRMVVNLILHNLGIPRKRPGPAVLRRYGDRTHAGLSDLNREVERELPGRIPGGST